ncbi:hypothetical protein CBM2595_A70010 [Cupriavidus taiwanensis]|nr:hypothetical protein CBM2595_A70010 [Cupriavidus taiwanensis]
MVARAQPSNVRRPKRSRPGTQSRGFLPDREVLRACRDFAARIFPLGKMRRARTQVGQLSRSVKRYGKDKKCLIEHCMTLLRRVTGQLYVRGLEPDITNNPQHAIFA